MTDTKIIITITETQKKALEYVTPSIQDWSDNAVHNRARIAIDDIVDIYTKRALDEGVQIPATRELIVDDAFTRGWVITAKEHNANEKKIFKELTNE
tara:strand:+ start:1210 stop:1500 length:291 start_codon:yes stop_codon:yes gene_type:complete